MIRLNRAHKSLAFGLGCLLWLLWAPLVIVGCSPGAKEREWVSVERGTLVVEVDISGTLKSVDSTAINPPGLPSVWNYKIAMLAPEGEEIEQGKPLVSFDTTDLGRKLQEKTAERDSAAKQLELVKASMRVHGQDNELAVAEAKAGLRKAKLKADAPAGITANIEIEKAQLDLELAKLNVKHAERKARASKRADDAEIERWRTRRDRAEQRVAEITASIAQMTVMAPRSGTVIYETNWKGEKKSVGDNTWRGDSIMQVVSLDKMEATGDVDEVDASRVAVGQPVSLRLDSQADAELRGEIKEIAEAVRRQSPDNPLKVIGVEITLTQTEGSRLRPGMRFWGRVETERVDDVLIVPLESVVATPQGPVVFRQTVGGVESVEVTLGRRNAKEVEVTAGLDEGDEIDASPDLLGREVAG